MQRCTLACKDFDARQRRKATAVQTCQSAVIALQAQPSQIRRSSCNALSCCLLLKSSARQCGAANTLPWLQRLRKWTGVWVLWWSRSQRLRGMQSRSWLLLLALMQAHSLRHQGKALSMAQTGLVQT